MGRTDYQSRSSTGVLRIYQGVCDLPKDTYVKVEDREC